ncbi:MAG TPA: winged helix-turn-helix domain-containing protein, partial [Rhodothermales bacterium]|nr:winged helix-turn-helix domain-containing protein [Rhodothermales bacterium]
MRNDFYIARWHVQPQRNRISGAEAATQVEPKIMQVLVYLAERAGDVVSRAEILDAVWSDVVVGEEVVSRSISELRKVFGDNPRSPAVIETIPKAGYRLMAPVSYEEMSGDHVPEPDFSVASFEHIRPDGKPIPTPWIVAAIVLVLVLVSVGIWLSLLEAPAPEPTHLVQTSPLTTSPGFEFAPALSPDGRKAAFIWTGGPENGPLNVYVKLIGAEEPLQLTDSPLYEWSPSWSPDGREIAFARSLHGLFVVPALGGSERKLTDISQTSRPEIDWSPLGDLIAFTDRESAQAPYGIYLYSFDTGATRPLTTPASSDYGDEAPAFSPDGQVVAF